MAEKIEIEGQYVIDTDNLAMCVSETTDTFGFGRKQQDEVVSVNKKNMEDDFRESVIFPFGDICGQSCISNGTKQGNMACVGVN